MASIDDPLIPQGCENFGATGTQFDDCNEVYVFGPARGMLIGPPNGSPIQSNLDTEAGRAEATAEITRRLALEDNDPDALRLLRPLTISMPATAPTFISVDGKQVATPTLRNYPVTISQMNDKNYEFARRANVNYSARTWILHDKFMYGGQEGVGAGTSSLQLSNTTPTEDNGLHTATGNLSYTGLYDPKRTLSPI